MATTTLIYCASGNKRFAQIAIDNGFKYGARLPSTIYHPVYFADQDWKNPNRDKYIAALAEHKPHMATVIDWERPGQLSEVIGWAEDAAQYVEIVLIIPKVIGGIDKLPREIGGAEIRLAYSVPTRYGGTHVPTWEFAGWPVHLLGGSPHKQIEMEYYLDVKSIDGNMANLMATRYLQFWMPGNAYYAKNRFWPTLKEENDNIRVEGEDLIYDAFEKSCKNIMQAWKKL